jgi:hypothetical protein
MYMDGSGTSAYFRFVESNVYHHNYFMSIKLNSAAHFVLLVDVLISCGCINRTVCLSVIIFDHWLLNRPYLSTVINRLMSLQFVRFCMPDSLYCLKGGDH